MDILNFISWLRSSRRVTTIAEPGKTLIPIGVKNNSRDDKYAVGAITVEDFTSGLSLANDRLVADDREVVLTDVAGTAELTFDQGTAVIQTTGPNSDLYISTVGSDDIYLESGDRIALTCGNGAYDQENEGGDLTLRAGQGSNGGTFNAGDGGDMRLFAGDAGSSTSGNQSFGGDVIISAGYTSLSGSAGGSVYISGGYSTDSLIGDVVLGSNYLWYFNGGVATLQFPVVTLATLPPAGVVGGTRAMINDSSVPAPGNFGVIATTGGSAIVPVFSDGVNWLIG